MYYTKLNRKRVDNYEDYLRLMAAIKQAFAHVHQRNKSTTQINKTTE